MSIIKEKKNVITMAVLKKYIKIHCGFTGTIWQALLFSYVFSYGLFPVSPRYKQNEKPPQEVRTKR